MFLRKERKKLFPRTCQRSLSKWAVMDSNKFFISFSLFLFHSLFSFSFFPPFSLSLSFFIHSRSSTGLPCLLAQAGNSDRICRGSLQAVFRQVFSSKGVQHRSLFSADGDDRRKILRVSSLEEWGDWNILFFLGWVWGSGWG